VGVGIQQAGRDDDSEKKKRETYSSLTNTGVSLRVRAYVYPSGRE
jgi:hypothetical protein